MGRCHPIEWFGRDPSAQSHKLGVVLMHPHEGEARDARASEISFSDKFTPSAQDRMCFNGFGGLGSGASADGLAAFGVVQFQDVAAKRGAPAQGGAKLQILSAARWTRASGREASGGGDDKFTHVRFWVREARLQAMLRAGWVLHVVTTDTWAALTKCAAPLSGGHIVRRL